MQRVVVVDRDQHRVSASHAPSAPTPCTAPAPAARRPPLRTTTLHAPALLYVARAVHAVQHQLVHRQLARRARVDRLRPTASAPLPRRTATSPRTATGRSSPSPAHSSAGARSSRAAALQPARRPYVQQQLLAVLRLREKPARATSHRNHLVPCLAHTRRRYLDASTRAQRGRTTLSSCCDGTRNTRCAEPSYTPPLRTPGTISRTLADPSGTRTGRSRCSLPPGTLPITALFPHAPFSFAMIFSASLRICIVFIRVSSFCFSNPQ